MTIENRGDALTHLLAEAKRFPMLTPEREQELARAWRNHRDEAALRDLVGSHLRLVIKIARGLAGTACRSWTWSRREMSG